MAAASSVRAPIQVYLELGAKRVFACALDWTGWCRSGRDEALALAALANYAPRYAPVAKTAGLELPAGAGQDTVVVERLPGTATTDFGAPDAVATLDAQPLTGPDAGRIAALLAASWTVFDQAVAGAPAELRKGPRGGGRDRDAIVDHVLGAEVAYARKLGLRLRQPAGGDTDAVAESRQAILAALRGESAAELAPVAKPWPPRYAARRIAWHVLDHAWEIEDRSRPARA